MKPRTRLNSISPPVQRSPTGLVFQLSHIQNQLASALRWQHRGSPLFMHSVHTAKRKRVRLIDLRLVELFYGEALMTPTNESQIVMNGAD